MTLYNFTWEGENYDLVTSAYLSICLQQGRATCRFIISHERYEVDFREMSQRNTRTGKIRRIALGAALEAIPRGQLGMKCITCTLLHSDYGMNGMLLNAVFYPVLYMAGAKKGSGTSHRALPVHEIELFFATDSLKWTHCGNADSHARGCTSQTSGPTTIVPYFARVLLHLSESDAFCPAFPFWMCPGWPPHHANSEEHGVPNCPAPEILGLKQCRCSRVD